MSGKYLVAILLSLGLADPSFAKTTRYLSGNAADVKPVLYGPALNLGGGSTDVDAALQAMIDLARGCRTCDETVDVVVLRAGGADGYNDYILAMNGVDSVETLVMTRRSDAFVPEVEATILAAEVVFFAGGDQCDYVTNFKGTPVEDAVERVFSRGGAVGGTSAGMAIQGEFVYDACKKSAQSDDILANPYHGSATFTYGFFNWPFMADTLTDQHFVARDRMGRLMGFLARQLQDGQANTVLGVAADEQTSIVLDKTGKATVYGNDGSTGTAYFVLADHPPGPGEAVGPKTPLSYLGYRIWIRNAGESFDLGNRAGNGKADKTISVIDGVIQGNPY
jgi:cyanophycinase